jgi:hypothetical protein
MRRKAALGVVPIVLLCTAVMGNDRTVGGFPMEDQIQVRRKAGSLAELVRTTRPTFVWNDSDMLWVERDDQGKPRFSLNHAYELDGLRGWVLLDARGDYVAEGLVDYLREQTAGQVISADPHHGSVYLLNWSSHHMTGTGPVDCTREILLLCDRKQKWHFIGEGVGTIDGRASTKRIRTEVSYKVSWVDSAENPLSIQATRTAFIIAHNAERDDTTTFRSRRDYTLSGKIPGEFTPASDDYLITIPGETLELLTLRLATCDTFYPFERDPRRKAKMIQSVAESIATLNPELPRRLAPGTRIRLPDLESIWDDARAAARPRKPSHAIAQVSDN